jgi:hypothetical protein
VDPASGYGLNWHPGSVSGFVNSELWIRTRIYQWFEEILEKKNSLFYSFINLLPIWQHIIFHWLKKFSGRIRIYNNWTSSSRSSSVSQDYRSGIERIIYESTTLEPIIITNTRSSINSFFHGLINYIDTKAKCCHLKKFTRKSTLLQVFIRVYRLEIQSVMLVLSTQICELLSL